MADGGPIDWPGYHGGAAGGYPVSIFVERLKTQMANGKPVVD
jgi:hypothetical protein